MKTIRDLIGRYRHKAGARERREDVRHAKWWCERIGDLPLSELTTDLIVAQMDQLAAYNRSPSTVNFYLRFLRRVCAWGTLLAYLPADPCAPIALPTERTPTPRVLSEQEETALCTALGPPYALWVKLAIETGLKQSEQFTLRWRDVDLDRARVLLPHPSTGAISSMDLSSNAVAILRQLHQLQAPSMWVFPDPKTPSRPVNIHAFYVGRWVTAVRRAGIPWVAWKDLRHTCGVRLAKQGRSIDDVVRLMRQRENRHAYTYRAIAQERPPKPKTVLPADHPGFADLSNGELQEVMLRDLLAKPLTFGEAARLYAVHHLKNRPSRANFERLYRQFWTGWTDRTLDSLTRKELRAWYFSLGHTPSHANKALTYVRSLYNWALNMELFTTGNPAVGIKRFPSTQRERFLSIEELQRVMAGLPHLPAKPRAYLMVLLFTGARRGEACQMRWVNIDLTTRLWTKARTKNGTSHHVPLPAQVMEVLNRLPRTSEWVFTGQNGQPWSGCSAEKTWAVIRRRWGLEDVRLHDLRRTCASLLAIEGENLPTIQSVLNHRSLAPTSIYARLNTKAVDRALQAQADRLCGLMEPPEVDLLEAPPPHAGGPERPLIVLPVSPVGEEPARQHDDPGGDDPPTAQPVRPAPVAPVGPLAAAIQGSRETEWPA